MNTKELITKAQQAHSLSDKELAELLGVTKDCIWNYKHERRDMRGTVLFKFLNIFYQPLKMKEEIRR